MFLVDHQILLAGVLLLVGVLSLRVSTRTGMPMLVVLLVVGMVMGSEGIGRIAFDNYQLAHALGTVALLVILFDSGLQTPLASVRVAWKPALSLATVGVFATAATVGAAAYALLHLPPLVALLIGSIVASTDAAAVTMALRSAGYRLDERLGATLELESGTNDPMAIFLTIGLIELVRGTAEPGLGLLLLFAQQMGVGALVGLGMGLVMAGGFARLTLRTAGLYPVLAMTGALLAFGVAAELGGSGFLAVYLAGIVLASRPIRARLAIVQFHDGLAWIAQLGMFLMLGLLSFPSKLLAAAVPGLVLAFALMVVARPLAVVLSLAPLRFSWREQVFVAWAGLKGAVPIVLGTYPLLLGVERGEDLFHLAFFAVALSALLQGWTLPALGRWLGLDRPAAPDSPVSIGLTALSNTDTDIVEYTLPEASPLVGQRLAHVPMPSEALVALVVRGDETLLPRGDTVLEACDHLFVMTKEQARPNVDAVLGALPKSGGEAYPRP